MGLLEILQEKGNELREPYSKHLEDGIFEIRLAKLRRRDYVERMDGK